VRCTSITKTRFYESPPGHDGSGRSVDAALAPSGGKEFDAVLERLDEPAGDRVVHIAIAARVAPAG
jgi:hypothetical protein